MNNYDIVEFTSREEWRDWLTKNHATTAGVWLRLYKKSSGIPTLNRADALDEAICFGWIDGQAKPYDENSWLQKYTPRRPRSLWSKKNTEHVERLIKEDRMHESGLKEVEKAKADGRWARAYEPAATIVIPEDFLAELSKNKKAEAFFKTLNKANTYAIAWRLQTAKKSETREKRMKTILQMMAKGEKFH